MQIAALTLAALYLYCVANGVERKMEIGGIRPVPNFKHYKMVSLTRRDGGDARVPGVLEFGLVESSGCTPRGDIQGLASFQLPSPHTQTEGSSIYLSFQEVFAKCLHNEYTHTCMHIC